MTDNNENTDIIHQTEVAAGKVQKHPYPKAVFFIISNEFCERFMYYGMRAILVLYLTRKLYYDDDEATIIFHVFSMLVYFLGIFGAIISDSWLGKFKTIFWLSLVYVLGSFVLSVAAIPTFYLPGRDMTLLGLALVALGSGGIKPCVAAFGGDQFKLPEQLSHIETYFSLFYFSINCGSLISSFITPILRHDVSCFDDDDCFSLAFGVPGLLMATSIIIFVSGSFLYVKKPPSGNMLVQVSKCIWFALRAKLGKQKTVTNGHWLDYAEPKFGSQLVNDTKMILKVLVLYIPLPVFWALYDQQGSRWTFQATRMEGDIGIFEVKPDQMLVLSSLLILVFIPLYDVLFYPLLAKVGIRRPLQKITLGGILAGISFLLSGIVELELEKTYPVLPIGNEGQLRIYNTFPCGYTFKTNIPGDEVIKLASLGTFEQKHVDLSEKSTFTYSMEPNSGTNFEKCPIQQGTIQLKPKTATSFYGKNGKMEQFEDDPNKSPTGDPVLRILVNSQVPQLLSVSDVDRWNQIRFNGTTDIIKRIDLLASNYMVTIDNKDVATIRMSQGAVFTMLVDHNESKFNYQIFEVSPPNSISILWLVPQYVVMGLGEVMYSVTGLQFSYSQAPESMKSVIQAFWLLTTAFGNVIDIIVVGANIFDSQASEFFLFAGIMFADMAIFILLAMRYKSVSVPSTDKCS